MADDMRCNKCRRIITAQHWVRLTGRRGNLWFHVACFYALR